MKISDIDTFVQRPAEEDPRQLTVTLTGSEIKILNALLRHKWAEVKTALEDPQVKPKKREKARKTKEILNVLIKKLKTEEI